jgi:hypothetical protein
LPFVSTNIPHAPQKRDMPISFAQMTGITLPILVLNETSEDVEAQDALFKFSMLNISINKASIKK